MRCWKLAAIKIVQLLSLFPCYTVFDVHGGHMAFHICRLISHFSTNFNASLVPGYVLCMVLLLKAGASLHIPHVYACLPARPPACSRASAQIPANPKNADRKINPRGGHCTAFNHRVFSLSLSLFFFFLFCFFSSFLFSVCQCAD